MSARILQAGWEHNDASGFDPLQAARRGSFACCISATESEKVASGSRLPWTEGLGLTYTDAAVD
jgi:hypothetical protein